MGVCSMRFRETHEADLERLKEGKLYDARTGQPINHQQTQAEKEEQDRKVESQNIKSYEKVEEKPVETQKEEVKEEVSKVAVTEEKVEDISIKTEKPFLDEDDIPPFLRKLRQ